MSFFRIKKKQKNMFYQEEKIIEILADELATAIKNKRKKRPVIMVCIGTDRSTGDALGPLVGMMIKEKAVGSFHIYGDIDQPVHALNLNKALEEIKNKHENPMIIGIDACLGHSSSVGKITIGEGPVEPGAGLNKTLPPVGELHITGTVNVGGYMDALVLQNTRLSLVMDMAKVIAKIVLKVEKEN